MAERMTKSDRMRLACVGSGVMEWWRSGSGRWEVASVSEDVGSACGGSICGEVVLIVDR